MLLDGGRRAAGREARGNLLPVAGAVDRNERFQLLLLPLLLSRPEAAHMVVGS